MFVLILLLSRRNKDRKEGFIFLFIFPLREMLIKLFSFMSYQESTNMFPKQDKE